MSTSRSATIAIERFLAPDGGNYGCEVFSFDGLNFSFPIYDYDGALRLAQAICLYKRGGYGHSKRFETCAPIPASGAIEHDDDGWSYGRLDVCADVSVSTILFALRNMARIMALQRLQRNMPPSSRYQRFRLRVNVAVARFERKVAAFRLG